MTREELEQYLIDDAEYTTEEVLNMSNWELVDNYLSYNGIIGYTNDILEVVGAVYGIELEEGL